MKKLFVFIILACTFTMTGMAQNAKKILDATAARMTQSGDVKVQFKATQFSGTTPQSEATGTLLFSGRKYQMTTEEISAWFDGETQWSMMKNSGEVNVATPDEEEQAAMNPATLVNIYKKGYKASLTKSSLRGRPTYVVHLYAKSRKAAFTDIIIDIDQATSEPLCLRAKKDGDWMRLSVLSFQNGLSLPASTFTFPSKDYPDIEVIDLR